MAFIIRQNPFSVGALPRTPLVSSRRPQDPLVGWRAKGTPLTILHPIRHRPTFGARHVCPSEFQSDLRLWLWGISSFTPPQLACQSRLSINDTPRPFGSLSWQLGHRLSLANINERRLYSNGCLDLKYKA